ncbi:unnamed protein product [Prorocentrum cordatum]|uniref:Uncharacterized protein n=1 Tax=Prorocentrum cordatum TaxID=2364126 RepID=A0ABN9VBR0_9DINO|nr:unnamed protein product [Polarella glacialis]
MDTWRKNDNIFRYLNRINPSVDLHGERWLYFGAFTNLWVIFSCVIDSYFVIGGSLSPKEIIMDSLGLLFLFNLDDTSGDVQFVSGDAWPGDRLVWVHDKVVVVDYQPAAGMVEWDHALRSGNLALGAWHCVKWFAGTCMAWAIKALQYLTAVYCAVMVVVLPVLVAVAPFLELTPQAEMDIPSTLATAAPTYSTTPAE